MKTLDWTGLFRCHQGRWVAFKSDHRTVVGTGQTLKSAKRAAAKKGCTRPFLLRVPKNMRHFVGAFQ